MGHIQKHAIVDYNSETDKEQCRYCLKAFPSTAALNDHLLSIHPTQTTQPKGNVIIRQKYTFAQTFFTYFEKHLLFFRENHLHSNASSVGWVTKWTKMYWMEGLKMCSFNIYFFAILFSVNVPKYTIVEPTHGKIPCGCRTALPMRMLRSHVIIPTLHYRSFLYGSHCIRCTSVSILFETLYGRFAGSTACEQYQNLLRAFEGAHDPGKGSHLFEMFVALLAQRCNESPSTVWAQLTNVTAAPFARTGQRRHTDRKA